MSVKLTKRRRKQLINRFLLVLFACVFVFSATYLAIYYYNSYKSERKVDELKGLIDDTELSDDESHNTDVHENVSSGDEIDNSVNYVDIDGALVQEKFVELYRKNHDFIGWITIEDTEIDYPVVLSMYDEEYYLHRDFDKNYSLAGTLFADTDCDIRKPSDNIMIYGHHMQSGKMFQNLTKYEKESFYNDHKFITFDTIEKDGTYEVIVAFKTKVYDEDYSGFKYYKFFDAANEKEFNEYVTNCKSLCEYDIPATATYGDELLTLSTCNYHTTNGRFVVVAKKIK